MKRVALAARFSLAVAGFVALGSPPLSGQDQVETWPTVGMEGRIIRTIDGQKLRIKSLEDPDASPLLVWIESATAMDKATRYDFRYIGYRDGPFDLGDYLTRDGGGEVPSLPVRVARIQPSTIPGELNRGLQVSPPEIAPPSWVSVGWSFCLAAGWLTCVGLILSRCLRSGRRSVPGAAAESESAAGSPVRTPDPELSSLARLALEGQLDEQKKIRMLALWRGRVGEVGGGRLEQLERWVLAPSPDGSTEVAAIRFLLDYLEGGKARPG